MSDQGRERGTLDTIKDATGMDTPNDEPAMTSGDQHTTEADGGEKTEVEGLAGLGATNRAFGGRPPQVQGGIGTDVPAADEEKEGSLDPRGY